MKLGDPFTQASADLRAQYARAKTAQWLADDIPWDAHEPVLSPGPSPAKARATRRELLAAFEGWSSALLGLASRLASELDNPDAQLLLAVHTRDYARHVEVWRLYAYRLEGHTVADTRGPVLPAVASEVSHADAVLIQRMRAAAVQATYAFLETTWPCTLGRAVCGRLRVDLERHAEALKEVAAHCDLAVKPQDPSTIGLVTHSSDPGVICYGMEQALRAELGDEAVETLARACAAALPVN